MDCTECPLMDRRGFLRTAAFMAIVTGVRRSPEEKAFPIPADDGVQIDKDLDLILSRTKGKVFAFSLACPHQNTAIKWEGDNHRFQCPKHHSIYTPEGVFVEGRATRGLDRFVVRKDGNSIVVNLDLLMQEDEDGDKWKTAFLAV
jgi:Rieske Fe-S protein